MPRFRTSLRKNDLNEGKLIRIDVEGKSIVITLINGQPYAMDSVCSHEGGPLEDGSLDGYNLICPWHQGIFDIRTAKASPDANWVTNIQSYAVIVDAKSGEISIDTDSASSDKSIKESVIQKNRPSEEKEQTALSQDIMK